MKKIFLGFIQTVSCPFLVITGEYVLKSLQPSNGAFILASLFGGCSLLINFIIGVSLLIKGYQERNLIGKIDS